MAPRTVAPRYRAIRVADPRPDIFDPPSAKVRLVLRPPEAPNRQNCLVSYRRSTCLGRQQHKRFIRRGWDFLARRSHIFRLQVSAGSL